MSFFRLLLANMVVTGVPESMLQADSLVDSFPLQNLNYMYFIICFAAYFWKLAMGSAELEVGHADVGMVRHLAEKRANVNLAQAISGGLCWI